jgi:DNA-binding protein YbaB
MTGTYDDEIEQLMTEYHKRRAAAGDRQRQIREITATAVAPRQTVKATVNVNGELVALEFPTGAYKRMAPNELTEAILAAVREASGKALEAFRELMAPQLPNGLNFIDLIKGKADLAEALPAEPPMPDRVRDYIESGRVPAPSSAGHHE